MFLSKKDKNAIKISEIKSDISESRKRIIKLLSDLYERIDNKEIKTRLREYDDSLSMMSTANPEAIEIDDRIIELISGLNICIKKGVTENITRHLENIDAMIYKRNMLPLSSEEKNTENYKLEKRIEEHEYAIWKQDNLKNDTLFKIEILKKEQKVILEKGKKAINTPMERIFASEYKKKQESLDIHYKALNDIEKTRALNENEKAKLELILKQLAGIEEVVDTEKDVIDTHKKVVTNDKKIDNRFNTSENLNKDFIEQSVTPGLNGFVRDTEVEISLFRNAAAEDEKRKLEGIGDGLASENVNRKENKDLEGNKNV